MDNDSTGNAQKLPLPERARRGLLLSETELSLTDILFLEHPADPAARKALSATIRAAIQYGDLPEIIRRWQRPGLLVIRDWCGLPPIQNKPVQCAEYRINQEPYRQWRAQCPKSLLSPLSQIHKWLGGLPTAESIPPVETSLPEKRQRQDALNHAIWAAIAVLSPSGALPRPHELFEYLAHNDATKTITGVAKGNRALLWIDDNGNEQRLTFSALGKRLDRIRKDG